MTRLTDVLQEELIRVEGGSANTRPPVDDVHEYFLWFARHGAGPVPIAGQA